MTEERIVEELLSRENFSKVIARRLETDLKYKPVITISRQPGSGGRPIGKLLAKKLGIKFYDRSLIEKVGKRMKLAPELLKKVDERSRSGIVDLVQNMFNPDYVSDQAYFRNLCKVILNVAQDGKAVIVGRGANFLIPQVYCLRVQVVAPYRVRVSRAVEFEHVNREEAREIIRNTTADRVGFVKQYFGKNIMSPKYYDLTLNSTFFTIDQSVELIEQAYKNKFK